MANPPTGASRILAVDLGDKHVGLALSDPLGITAQGLESFSRCNLEEEARHLNKICDDRKVERCIVGLPLRLSGEAGFQAKAVLAWVEAMKTRLHCPIFTWDERLTSKEASRLMITEGLSRKKQKTKSDQLAAILILQHYLEQHRIPAPDEDTGL